MQQACKHNNKQRKDKCATCVYYAWRAANPQQDAAIKKAYRERHPVEVQQRDQVYRKAHSTQIQEWRRKRDHGVSLEEYNQFVSGPCGICGTIERPRVLDHCHATGRRRGPLCRQCNLLLGWFEKNCAGVFNWLKVTI